MNQPAVELHLLKVGSCRHIERVAMQGGRWRAVSFPSLAALIIHPAAGPILFDTGYAEHFFHATRTFPERLYRWMTPVDLPPRQSLVRQLSRFGIEPGDIGLCIISHAHGDHIAGLRDVPRAEIVAMRAAYQALTGAGRIGGLIRGQLPALLPADIGARIRFAESYRRRPLGEPWTELGPGFDLIGDSSLLAIPLPGHAAGHMGLLVRDGQGRQVLLSADSSWSLRAVRECRLPSFIARPVLHHWADYRDTLMRLQRLSLHDAAVILPSHCEASLAAYDAAWVRQ